MNGSHVSEESFDAYVSDVLDADARSLLESHVSACEPCGSALLGHARAEQALYELAPSFGATKRATAVLRSSAVAAGLFAVLGIGWALHSKAPSLPEGAYADVLRPAGDAGVATVLDLAPDHQ